jgi:hypothetical protein
MATNSRLAVFACLELHGHRVRIAHSGAGIVYICGCCDGTHRDDVENTFHTEGWTPHAFLESRHLLNAAPRGASTAAATAAAAANF